jgi:hypothetical protein
LPGLVAGIGLLSAGATSVRGQGSNPPMLGQPPTTPPTAPVDPGVPDGPGRFEVVGPVSPWYADAEFAVLFTGAVHFNEHFAAVTGDSPVFLSPRVYLGRDLEIGGSIRFTYRNLTQVVFPGYGNVGEPDFSSGQSFSTNWFDLDYVSREYAPLDGWRLRWEIGGRLVYRHQGSWYQTSYTREDYSDNFFAGGPHFGLTSQWDLGRSGWYVYGRADTAITFGGGTTVDNYQPRQTDPWGYDVPRTDRMSYDACQFDLGLQLAVGRRWQWRGRDVGLAAGVQMDVISLANMRGEFAAFGFVNVGPFVRWEMRF